jgi:hypothetical protein
MIDDATIQAVQRRGGYGAWWDTIIATNAKEGVRYSAERYVHALRELLPER